MKNSLTVLLSGLLLTVVIPTTYAAEDQIVMEDLSRAELRREIKKIQTEVYRVFNVENKDDKLDIICHDYLPTGSNIKEEACEPQFVIDRRAQNAANSRLVREDILPPSALRNELSDQFKVLTDAMNAVAKESRYFRELNSILEGLKETLEEKAR